MQHTSTLKLKRIGKANKITNQQNKTKTCQMTGFVNFKEFKQKTKQKKSNKHAF